MFHDDYILRLVHQLVVFVTRVAGLNDKGEHDKAIEAADQALGALIDAPRGLIDAVDSATLAGMLREPAKIRAAAQLFHEQGKALAAQGDAHRAAMRHRRALELALEARALEPTAQDDAVIDALSRWVPDGTLAARYRHRG